MELKNMFDKFQFSNNHDANASANKYGGLLVAAVHYDNEDQKNLIIYYAEEDHGPLIIEDWFAEQFLILALPESAPLSA